MADVILNIVHHSNFQKLVSMPLQELFEKVEDVLGIKRFSINFEHAISSLSFSTAHFITRAQVAYLCSFPFIENSVIFGSNIAFDSPWATWK